MLKENQKRHLKALAHARKPVVIAGANGITDAVLDETTLALADHELIKVRINAGDRAARAQRIEHLCQVLEAELIQRIGHVATLFRRNPESPRIALP